MKDNHRSYRCSFRLPYYLGGHKARFQLAAKDFFLAYLSMIIACTVLLLTLQAFTEKEVMSVIGRELGRLLQMV